MRKITIMLVQIMVFALAVSAADYPRPNANPWIDDYSELAGMQNWKSWGTYNVHDPAIFKVGDTYYMYSTDAIFRDRRRDQEGANVPVGNIHVRSSKDLVNWAFEGWAFKEIPAEARQWVLDNNNNRGGGNIWAPFPVQYKDKFRLYYCVSAFGQQTSFIGLAEATSPLGPWEIKGPVVRTKKGDRMNAIDPSIEVDPVSGKMWMHYGSYFGGLYAVELNPETGYPVVEGDQGIKTAGRANFRKDNIEAPEVIYNPELKKYFLFVSYDPLMTTYNVRVGRSDKLEGPYYDFFGKDMRDTTNNYPILTHPYQFENHPGWAGVAHNGIIDDGAGNFYMAHQARLSPDNHLMVLHVREIKWLPNGWPVVSPQRYAGTAQQKIKKADIPGAWEIIRINDVKTDRELEYGQILWGQNQLRQTEVNTSSKVVFEANGKLNNTTVSGKWDYSVQKGLSLELKNEKIENLIIFVGQDWENQTETLLFTGLDSSGRSVWGKKVKE